MGDPRNVPERIELALADDPRDVVHRVVACLARGGLVGLPTETSYAIAASATEPQAISRLAYWKELGPHGRLSLALRSADQVRDWVPELTETGSRLTSRAWPGPITFIASGGVEYGLASRLPPSVRGAVAPGSTIGLRLPGHDLARSVLSLVAGPLVLTSARRNGQTAPKSAEPFAALNGLDLVIDDGPSPVEGANAVAEIDADGWRIVRAGPIDAATLTEMAGRIVLFVCTGNTCRSPMAEAICKDLLAQRLAVSVEDLPASGHVILSAGLAAYQGARAAAEAVEVIQSRGGSLRRHASRQVTPELVARADWIVTMTRDHREALLDYYPEASDRVRLLHARGDDIDDPIGSDRETYRRTAREIEEQLTILLDVIEKESSARRGTRPPPTRLS